MLAAFSGVFFACEGGTEDGDETLIEETPTQATSDIGVDVEGGDDLFFSLLSIIPDTEYNRYGVIVDNFARVREFVGTPPPDQYADDDVLLEYLNQIKNMDGLVSHVAPWISGYNYTSMNNREHRAHAFLENREHLAFSFLNVDQSVTTTLRPNVFEVVKGRFNPYSTENALERCDECPSPQKIDHRGIEFYSWSEGSQGRLKRRFTPPIFDHVGNGGQLAVFDSWAFRTIESVDMKLLLDSQQGLVPSLADDSGFAYAAKEMDKLEIYSGGLKSGETNYPPIGTPSSPHFDPGVFCLHSTMEEQKCSTTVMEHIRDGLILEKYDVIASGGGHDENGYFIAIVFVYGDDGQASSNEGIFRRIWEQGVDFRTGETWREVFSREPSIKTQGRVLTVRLNTTSLPRWQELLYGMNSLLWHR